jgi:glycosyltransferase involved in cell wall biosynthesis
MKILHVIPSYPPATAYTGPPAALHRLCRELVAQGVEVRVATTNANGGAKLPVAANAWTDHEGVPVFYGNRWGGRGDLSPGLWRCIRTEVANAHLLHVTAIYSWPILSAAAACHRRGVPLVVSPRGSLAPEALAWRSWKKKVFMGLGGGRAFRAVAAFHASTVREEADVHRIFPGATTGVVPNGVDIPEQGDLDRWRSVPGPRTLLYLGRLHPHKNVDLLLRAWASCSARYPEVELILAGPGEAGTLSELKRMAAGLGLGSRVRFAGMVRDEEKNSVLARAAVLVLPSKSENFGNVVVEALAHGTPVIASQGTPWDGLVSNRCGWWVEAEEAKLSEAIGTALAMDTEKLRSMGRTGREWMKRDFAWPAVAARMKDFYGGVLDAAKPAR